MGIPKHKLDRKLMRALTFNEFDLRANRGGRLTERQCKVWRVQQGIPRRTLTMGVIALFLTLAVLSESPNDPVIWIFSTVTVSAFFIGGAVWDISRIRTDLKNKRVEVISGRVSLTRLHWRRIEYMNYYVIIKHRRFGVDRETWEAFQEDEPYTIYFTPRAEMVVAAEPLYM